ncbi:MAG TPA: hypothetical protein VLU54_08510 [Casimicrobiaceae bacterium]|nr:hypothetical protein [Casimicrobiaceae bacterium]
MDQQKPEPKLELTLVKATDADAIIAAFTKVTGKTPTQAEIDVLRAEIAREKDAGKGL